MVEIREIGIERDELADSIGGGFPSGSLGILEGRYGTGKSLLSQRLTYGFLENDYSVSYISTELTVKGFIEQMNSLRYNITSKLLDHSLLFIPIYPLVSEKEGKMDLSTKLMEGERIFKSDIIFIDTFSFLILQDPNPDSSLSKLDGFFQKLLAQDKTILLTSEPGHKELLSSLYSSAHLLIELVLNQQGGRVSHEIEIKRFAKAGGSVSRTIAFRVEPKIGFVMEITSVG